MPPRVEKSCRRCQHIARPGLSSGHCGGGRHDPQDKKRAADERQAEIDQAAQWAAAVWRSGKDTETHDYLAKKKLVGSGGDGPL